MRAEPIRIQLFKIAERLGYTVSELAGRIDMQELTDWEAYDRIKAAPEKPTAVTLDVARVAFAPKRSG